MDFVHVLTVDDNSRLGEILRAWFDQHDIPVTLCEMQSVRELILCPSRHDPLMIVFDLNLNDGIALEHLQTLRAHFAKSVIIALSLFDIDEYREASLKAGASYFAVKRNLIAELDRLITEIRG